MKDRIKSKQLLISFTAKEMKKAGYNQYKNTPVFYKWENDQIKICYPTTDFILQHNMLYCEWVTLDYQERETKINIKIMTENWTFYWIALKYGDKIEDYLLRAVCEFYKKVGYYSGIKKIIKNIKNEQTFNIVVK